ncbi:hemolysin secretion protein D [Bradyrhizobium sp. NAS80.1]|uniref:HlyD family type I secretion periplasmic adaptor subunit n=1 Tax=Bradyrhizobium sp. NAS80.1 TaxID=1680159 RepID=UPI000963011D|nr:HlyD family type I secretion periplasmic adaptor subunit [Bradyrhizobium sp. NAS80.1]OKO88461.1 hemolysin secretion protein D [Bradyrhizobium sp. NAS80.1]
MTAIEIGHGFDAGKSIHRHSLLGAAGLVAVFLGFGGWAATTEISGALVAQGSIVVDSNVKKVQHPTGGVVGALNVHDGSIVHAGDVVVRLDETQLRANLGIVEKALDELSARAARLQSERDGLEAMKMPEAFLNRQSTPYVLQVMDGERKLFNMRRAARAGQKEQLQQRIVQLEEEVRGLESQQESKGREIDLVQEELKGVKDLWDKHLIQMARLTSLERDAARLGGERAQLIASIAQSRGKMAEIRLQIFQVDQDLASDVSKELREIDSKIGENGERKIAAVDQLERIDIRAPQDGIVHELSVHTVGGVVKPGEDMMLIVPVNDTLDVEVKIQPQDIDQLALGQTAGLRFTAFNARTTPEIDGVVNRIAANTTTDQRTGQSYYSARIGIAPAEIARLGDVKLVPGMVVESFIKTADRTVLSYLTKPLADQVTRAFRER